MQIEAEYEHKLMLDCRRDWDRERRRQSAVMFGAKQATQREVRKPGCEKLTAFQEQGNRGAGTRQ